MKKGAPAFYAGRDPRLLPAYGLPEAAHYLRIPAATLRSWSLGRYYPIRRGTRFFRPLLAIAAKGPPLLSFINLVEAHVLDGLRREHEIPLEKVRRALDYVTRHFPSKHPLAEESFETDGLNLFIERYGQLINVSADGQLAMKEVLRAHLRRIEHDETGLALRLFPFTRKRQLDEPKFVVIDPFISFGRPVLRGSGVATAVIADRYKAGESIQQLAGDYGREPLEIEEAIRCELEIAA